MRNILSGVGCGFRDSQVDIGGNAFVELLRQADFGPLAAAPARAVLQAIVERGQRKIEQHGEGELIVEEVVDHVCGGIVAAEGFVEGKHGAEIEIELLAEGAIDFVHVAAQLFEKQLEAVEHGVESGLITGEVGADEVFEGGGVTVVGTPEFGDLMQALLSTRTLGLATFRDQFGFHFGGGRAHPRGLNGFGGCG